MRRWLQAACLVPILSVAFASEAPPAGARRHTVLMASNPAGHQLTWGGQDGEIRCEWEYNDRGRGPKLRERLVVGPGGVPTSVEIAGVDYYKKAVEEKLSVDAGRASWKNSNESGEKEVSGQPFYVSVYGCPEEWGVFARALLAAPNQTLSLLPEGEASIERVGELKVTAGGKSRTVVHYAISGLGLTPQPVWLDPDGTYFAYGSAWFAVVPEGWESVVPDLVKAQDEAEAARFAAIARSLPRKPPGALAFRGATLFDSEKAVERRGMTVVVNGQRITAVGPDAEVQIPDGSEIIDASGKTLLPGLWDMHVHLGGLDNGLLHLAAGITTVRDLANDTDSVLELKRKFDSGVAIGPRMLLAGFIDGPGPYQGPTKVLASTPEEIRAAIGRYADLGYVQIKLYSSLKPELVPVAVEEAHRLGLRVSGHIPNTMSAEQCVKLGFDEIQHANFLVLNFLDPKIDTRTPSRFIEVAEHAAEVDLKSDRVRAFIALLKERDTVLDPTLNAFEDLFVDRPGQMARSVAAIADRLPPQVRRGFLQGGLPVPEGKDEHYRAAFRAVLAFVAEMHKSGIRLVPGTDAFPGFAYHRELELWVEAGIPAAQALQRATLGSAQVHGREKELGSITPGKLADLVLVNGEPIWNIPDIRKTELVVKDGVVYKSAELYKALGVRP